MKTPTFPPLSKAFAAAALAVGAMFAPAPPAADGGCLAPTDVQVDVSGQIGGFWGNDSGRLLYARGIGAGQDLVARNLGSLPEVLASAGEQNDFFVGISNEVWAAFHAGFLNERGDVGFAASTTVDDDPATIENENLPRRGAYVLRGNTFIELGRYGQLSPVPLPPEQGPGFANWASFFDVVPLGRDAVSPLRVVFSAQLAAPDGRYGLFSWDESVGTAVPLLLTGDPSPAEDGSPTGLPFTILGRVRANEAGDVCFYALTQAPESETIEPWIFRIDRDGVRSRVLRFGADGDAAPGGGQFALLQDFDVDGAGGLLFAASVEGVASTLPQSGLFRATPPGDAPVRLLADGDANDLGVRYGSFADAQVRSAEDGTAVFVVPLSEESLGSGFFSIPAGTPTGAIVPVPLASAQDTITLASLGGGRAAYQTSTQTRTIVPADGEEEGPGDFRVALVDLRNSARPQQDSLRADLRFRLAPWGTEEGHAPAAVLTAGAVRSSPVATLTASDLARIAEVRLKVSEASGQTFLFGIGGTEAAPKGTLTVNGFAGVVSSLKLSKARDQATWRFTQAVGKGTFSIDLTKGTAKLTLTKGNLNPSFEAQRFPIEFTLRTDGDVAAARTGAAAYFHRAVRLDADQPSYGTGRRVLSHGERVPGGGLFVDTLRVARKLKVVRGQAAPHVTSDAISMSGTIRLCPGSTPPTTPTLRASVTIGDVSFTDFPLVRIGKRGAKYAGKLASGAAQGTLVVDSIGGRFTFTAKNVPPLSQCVDADFTPGAAVNPAKAAVGGMVLPISITIARTYASDFDVAITRLPGGKSFIR